METAWLIERNDVQLCLGRICDGAALSWVTFTDPGAIKFTTKEEADKFAQHHCMTHLATSVSHVRARETKMAKKSGMARPKCRCVDMVDKTLAAYHSRVVTTLFTGMVAVCTEVVSGAPKRTQPTRLIATFCPFCGERYPGTDTTTKRGLRSVRSS